MIQIQPLMQRTDPRWVWLNDLTLDLLDSETVVVSGTLHFQGQVYPVVGSGALYCSPYEEVAHEIVIGSGGTVLIDPPPLPPGAVWAHLAWVHCPAGTTDLHQVTFQRIWHVAGG